MGGALDGIAALPPEGAALRSVQQADGSAGQNTLDADTGMRWRTRLRDAALGGRALGFDATRLAAGDEAAPSLTFTKRVFEEVTRHLGRFSRAFRTGVKGEEKSQ